MNYSFDIEWMLTTKCRPIHAIPMCEADWFTDSITTRIEAGKPPAPRLYIDKVIFNGPATIVYWDDGTKTVVKCKPDDPYSKDAGVAMATLKKILGNSYGRYLTKVRKEIEKAK